MPSSKVMHLDASRAMRRLGLFNKRILPGKIRRGLTAAGTKFMTDVVISDPTTPIRRPGYADLQRKAGELRASGALFVDGVKKGSTVKYGEKATGRYQPDKYGGLPIAPGSHEACLVFNAPYAATQHELFPAKTEPTAGKYYMSKKLYGNGVEYISIVAQAVRL